MTYLREGSPHGVSGLLWEKRIRNRIQGTADIYSTLRREPSLASPLQGCLSNTACIGCLRMGKFSACPPFLVVAGE